uniref:Uncharacterized protein n=1 Tax=Anopheles dirus TaxID=7168 RepID=A0A182NIX6_9DIPT
MAMVVSGRAKAVIAAFVCFFLLGIVLVTGSTKGWFVPMRYNERVAARVQVSRKPQHSRDIGAQDGIRRISPTTGARSVSSKLKQACAHPPGISPQLDD